MSTKIEQHVLFDRINIVKQREKEKRNKNEDMKDS